MTLKRPELFALADATNAWITKINCNKALDKDHEYFTIIDWCNYFDHTPKTFGKVKENMVERGWAIALRPRKGHYISDTFLEISTNMELSLRNVVTRLETIAAMWDSSQNSPMTDEQKEEILDRLNETISAFSTKRKTTFDVSFGKGSVNVDMETKLIDKPT